jgi:flagellar hook-associated protein 1 FlgK
MSLAQAISSALSGLRLTQAGVGLVAENIANAETPGYVRKSTLQGTSASTAGSNGVQLLGVRRELDLFIQRQLRAEFAGASYARNISGYYARIEQIYGQPGNLNAIDTLYNNFTNSLQALTTSPESVATRSQVLNDAAVLAQQLNAMSTNIQRLRGEAESSLAGAVDRVNQILVAVENISLKLSAADANSPESAALLDQRDVLIGELSGFMDIRVVDLERGQVAIFTLSGVSLYDHKAARLSFDGSDAVGAQSLWSSDEDERRVGTIKLVSPAGHEVDLVADKAIRSGAIAAYLEMRDRTLVEAQAQLDEIAHALATALSARTVSGTPVAGGPPDGFNLDLSALLDGNTVSLTYTDNTTAQQHRVTIVRVDDTNALPLDNDFTADPGDTVIGVDFSGGMGGVATALNAALAATGLVFSNPAGSTLRVVDDGGPDLWDVDSFDASVTTATLDSGDPTLPFFIDGGTVGLYTNAVTSAGQQKLGFAGRIAVNPSLKSNPSGLVAYASGTAAGDPTRPEFMVQQLTAAARQFSAEAGIGSANSPYSGTLGDYVRQTLARQGSAAENAARLNEGQEVVVNALQTRFAERSGVNIDAEMAHLLMLQNAYGANARVLSAVKEMIDALMRI